jgi:PEP-CTERM motif
MHTTPTPRIIKLVGMTVTLLCLFALFQMSVQADTLTIIGSSNSQNPVTASGQIGFIGQAFSSNFNVTATGQTFDFVFGQFQLQPGAGGDGDSGCTDGPCFPITLTGNLTTPAGALSFGGLYEETEFGNRSLLVNWMTGSGPFNFITPEGGVVVFTMELVDFAGFNGGATPLLFNQIARITVTGFQPGAGVPEPATMVLLGSGLAGLFAARRRRKQS